MHLGGRPGFPHQRPLRHFEAEHSADAVGDHPSDLREYHPSGALGWDGIWVRRLPDAWVMLDELCLWIRMQRMVVGIATEAAHGFSGTSMS